MIRVRYLRSLAGLTFLVLGVAACGEADVGASSTSSIGDTSSTTTLATTSTTTTDVVTTTTLETTTTTEGVAGQIVQVLFAAEDQSDCSNVTASDRSVDEAAEPIGTAFELLVAGPTAEEGAEGAGSFFSNETAGMLRSTELSDGLLTVDFGDLRPVIPNASTSCGSFSLIAQLNGTAFQFPEVERVTYQIEGNCDAFFNWLQRDCQEYLRP